MGKGHPVYMLPLRALPLPPSAHISPFTLFQQRLFEQDPKYTHLVDNVLDQLNDPFIKGEVLHFCHVAVSLTPERQKLTAIEKRLRDVQ